MSLPAREADVTLEYFCCQSSAQQQKDRLPALPLPHAWTFWPSGKGKLVTQHPESEGVLAISDNKKEEQVPRPGKTLHVLQNIYQLDKLTYRRGYGAARLTPDQKVGSLNLSGLNHCSGRMSHARMHKEPPTGD